MGKPRPGIRVPSSDSMTITRVPEECPRDSKLRPFSKHLAPSKIKGKVHNVVSLALLEPRLFALFRAASHLEIDAASHGLTAASHFMDQYRVSSFD